MKTAIYTFVSVFIVSAISLIGVVTLSLRQQTLRKILLLFVSFAVGALFADAFIHLIPEAFKKTESELTVSLCIIAGVLIFFCIERFLRWRHCHEPASAGHPHPIVPLNLIGDGVHNFMDGIVIAASYIVSVPVGLATTLAVILHEIPQELGDFGVLIHGGLSVKRALAFNFLSALTAVAGAGISLLFGSHIGVYTGVLLPITAGGFIYIAGSGIIPELQNRCDIKLSTSIMQLTMILLGVGIMVLLKIFE